MAIIRVMNILQAPSGEPKDRYVNTLHFNMQAESITEDVQLNVGGALDTFWSAIDPYIPSSLTREDYRFYDLGDLEPREPTYVAATAQPVGGVNALPYEVAAALSYYAGRNLKRYRGRLFLGPLTTAVMAAGAVNDDPQISSTFRGAAVAALATLQADVQSAGGDGAGSLSIFSPTDGIARVATHAWMDNAFDTIRSRGTVASTRTQGDLV